MAHQPKMNIQYLEVLRHEVLKSFFYNAKYQLFTKLYTYEK
jgi:hypothetical protein